MRVFSYEQSENLPRLEAFRAYLRKHNLTALPRNPS